ncbi:MAG: hypothetical protein AAF993_10035 [Pseudomonadota bacterium]
MLEAKGLVTLTIGTVRPHIEKVKPPRGLICDFPLGRPLGKPGDDEFQHQVLARLFDLLGSAQPVLQDFPVSINTADEPALMCSLPPRMNPDEHPAVDESRGIKGAYDRALREFGNRIGATREITPEQVPDAIAAFVRIQEGTEWQQADIPGNPMRVAQDIRGYYQTAALALAEHSPGAWAGENWFYEQTETGRLMLDVRRVLKAAGAPQPLWFYLSPGDRPA